MKALAIDCAVSRLVVAAKNDDKTMTAIYDIGMKQSETLVPAIDYVLSKVGLETKDLDYSALTIGPGSFTGLRLAISALKAIELAFNVPVYGISSLKTYEYPFLDFGNPVVSVIDANKDKFYARITNGSSELLCDGDYELEEITAKLKDLDKFIIAGPDFTKFKELIEKDINQNKILCAKNLQVTTDALFELAEAEIAKNNPPLQDYDGPVYLRASEAELVKAAKDLEAANTASNK